MELLQNLSTLLTFIEITEKNVSSVLDAILAYCRDDQHRQLQDSSVEFLYQLAMYDGTAVYVKLIQFRNTDCYRRNVNKVLNRLLYIEWFCCGNLCRQNGESNEFFPCAFPTEKYLTKSYASGEISV